MDDRIEKLIKELKWEEPLVRCKTIQKLGETGDPHVIEPLIQQFSESEKILAKLTEMAVDKINYTKKCPYQIYTAMPIYREQESLDKYSNIWTIALIAEVIEKSIIIALTNLGQAALEPLLASLDVGNVAIRRGAALTLGEIGKLRTLEPLIKLLLDKEKRVRLAAADALIRLGWMPNDDIEKIYYSIAKNDWETCLSFGAVAIGPLTEIIKRTGGNNDAVQALEKVYSQITTVSFGRIFSDNPKTTLVSPNVLESNLPLKILNKIVIDALSYDLHQVERFITYAVNHIGRDHLKKNVEVHVYGDHEKLHGNLRNLFEDLFKAMKYH